MAHEFHKHRESQRAAGRERYKEAGGSTKMASGGTTPDSGMADLVEDMADQQSANSSQDKSENRAKMQGNQGPTPQNQRNMSYMRDRGGYEREGGDKDYPKRGGGY